MRDDVRAYLGMDTERRARASGFFRDVPEIDDDLGDVILDAQITAAERLDPTRAATSLLIVRLSGPGITDGWIDQGMQDAIMGPLTQEVE